MQSMRVRHHQGRNLPPQIMCLMHFFLFVEVEPTRVPRLFRATVSYASTLVSAQALRAHQLRRCSLEQGMRDIFLARTATVLQPPLLQTPAASWPPRGHQQRRALKALPATTASQQDTPSGHGNKALPAAVIGLWLLMESWPHLGSTLANLFRSTGNGFMHTGGSGAGRGWGGGGIGGIGTGRGEIPLMCAVT